MQVNSNPTVIGLAGKAGTGKTVTAQTIAPTVQFNNYENFTPITYDHTFLAVPLYTLASIKTKTKGVDSYNRMAHQIHQQLFQIFNPGGLPPYRDMVELVGKIYEHPIPTDEKPRTFLQNVGTWCRDLDPECFTQFMRNHILDRYRLHLLEAEHDGFVPTDWHMFVSDIRYPNEAAMIRTFERGVLIKLECEEHVRLQRLSNRDGRELSPEEAKHSSENSLSLIPDENFHAILDTTDLNVEEQAEAVKSIIHKFLEG